MCVVIDRRTLIIGRWSGHTNLKATVCYATVRVPCEGNTSLDLYTIRAVAHVMAAVTCLVYREVVIARFGVPSYTRERTCALSTRSLFSVPIATTRTDR